MTVVLDTNVFISALIHPGTARAFLFRLIAHSHTIALSDFIKDEVETVLARAKFKNRTVFQHLWALVAQNAVVVTATGRSLGVPLRDPKDHPIIITALRARASIIVTGDDDLLSLKRVKHIQIVTIREFLHLSLPALKGQ